MATDHTHICTSIDRDAIRAAMQEAGLGIRAAARELGVSTNTIQRLLDGDPRRVEVVAEQIVELCQRRLRA